MASESLKRLKNVPLERYRFFLQTLSVLTKLLHLQRDTVGKWVGWRVGGVNTNKLGSNQKETLNNLKYLKAL